MRVSGQFGCDVNGLLLFVLVGLGSAKVGLNVVKILDQLVAQFDLSNVLLELFLLFILLIFLLVLKSPLFSFDIVDFSALDFHLPFDPINIVFLFPISLLAFVEFIPKLVVLLVQFLDLFFSFVKSLLLGFLPLFPLLVVLFFLFKEFFLVSIKILFQTINGFIFLIQDLLYLVVLLFKWLLFLSELFNLVVKLLFSLVSLFNLEIDVTDCLSVFHLSLQEGDLIVEILLIIFGQCGCCESVFEFLKLF